MSNDLTTSSFSFQSNAMDVLNRDGQAWFFLNQICHVLDIAEPHRAASRLDDDEKGRHTVTTLGGPQQVTIISESGLYGLVMTSRKPAAKAFSRWVRAEVLPEIRKTGSYIAKPQVKVQQPVRLSGAALREVNRLADRAFALRNDLTASGSYALLSHVVNAAAGIEIIPPQVVERPALTAGQVGELFGISANMVGKLANQHGLKREPLAICLRSVAENGRSVDTWRYTEEGVQAIRDALASMPIKQPTKTGASNVLTLPRPAS